MSTILDPIRGVDFDRYVTPKDYAENSLPTGFISGTEEIRVTVWPASGGQSSVMATLYGTWMSTDPPVWHLRIPGTVTANWMPGPYRFLAVVSKSGETGELLSGDLLLSGSGVASGIPAASPVADLPTAASLGLAAPLWCSDENIAVRCGPDLKAVMPTSQILADGNDGVFDAADPWTLTSASNDFARQIPPVFPIVTPAYTGVTITYAQIGHLVRLDGPSSLVGGSGQTLAVAAVSSGGITLRRLGMGGNVGSAPGPGGGCPGVRFSITTFAPQIEEATYRINQRFGIDPLSSSRAPSCLEDIRPLRQLAVARVLYERYSDIARRAGADYYLKAQNFAVEIQELESQLDMRWKDEPDRDDHTPLIFSARYGR